MAEFECGDCGRFFETQQGLRTHKTQMEGRPWHDRQRLYDLYHEKRKSSDEIGDMLGCHGTTIRGTMRKMGIPRRTNTENMQIYAGRGPVTIKQERRGYERVSNTFDGEDSQFRLHRLVAVAEWGFDAVADSVVHHKNGIKWDNRPDNLELFDDSAEHVRQHAFGDPEIDLGYRDEEVLRDLYLEKGLSTYEIGDRFDVHRQTIGRWLEKFGIEKRPPDGE